MTGVPLCREAQGRVWLTHACSSPAPFDSSLLRCSARTRSDTPRVCLPIPSKSVLWHCRHAPGVVGRGQQRGIGAKLALHGEAHGRARLPRGRDDRGCHLHLLPARVPAKDVPCQLVEPGACSQTKFKAMLAHVARHLSPRHADIERAPHRQRHMNRQTVRHALPRSSSDPHSQEQQVCRTKAAA